MSRGVGRLGIRSWSRTLRSGGGILFAVVVVAAAAGISWFYSNSVARTWDEVDFALALDRYDLLAMQPHFPGYPYFILGGWLVHQWVSDPAQALALFNTLAACSSAIPMVLLARRFTGSGAASFWLPALVLTSPYMWLMSARPMSECAGLAALWWFMWAVLEALERPHSWFRHILALALFSLLMGIRLSFFPFGLLLLPLWIALYQKDGSRLARWSRLSLSAACALLFQLIWVAGLVLSEGSLSGFWKLSAAFLEGHFSDWGGGVVSIPMPLGERVVRLVWHNLLGSAVLGGSWLIGVLLLLTVGLSFLAMEWNVISKTFKSSLSYADGRVKGPYFVWLAGSTLVYFLWALLGQNIEKPRHIVPVVAPLLLALFVLALRSARTILEGRASATGERHPLKRFAGAGIYILLVLLILTQLAYGAPLLKKQSTETPAVYQLHQYMSKRPEPFELFTWEETRMLHYAGAKYNHERIYTFGYFQALVDANPTQKVYLTDHVLTGFEQQGVAVSGHVRQAADFKSDPRFDPVYGNITLYEWLR